MNFTVAAGVLAGASRRLAKVVERKGTIPILANVLVEALDGGTVRLTATDLDVVMTVAVEADVGAAGAVTVNAEMLAGFAGKLDRAAEMGPSDRGFGAVLKLACGRSRMALVTLPAADFPEAEAFEGKHEFEVPAGDLAALLATRFAAEPDGGTRYYMAGVYLHAAPPPSPGPRIESGAGSSPREGGEVLRAVATDGHRLARVDRDVEVEDGLPGVIVPHKVLGIAAAWAADHDEDTGGDTIDVEVSDARIAFTFPNLEGRDGDRLVSKLIDGSYPDYARVIPTGNSNVVTADRAALIAALDRVSVLGDGKSRAVKLSASANESGGVLRLEAKSPEAGEASDEIDAGLEGPGSGERVEIGFNGKYLGEVLRQVGGARVRIAIADAASPAVFTEDGVAEADARALYVIMPLRV